MNFSEQNKKYTVEDFLNFVEILRSPKGCPWDKFKTHADLRSRLIEEAYEVIEALDSGDNESLKEELGNILLQVALHCSIASENNNFSFADVVDSACNKIITTHPHLFYGTECKRLNYKDQREDPKTLQPFEISREKLKGRHKVSSSLESVSNVSKILPSLMRTEKIQERAAKGGYGLFDVDDALNETFERLHYLESLILSGKEKDYEPEIGNLLFAITEISRLVGVDAECALYGSCERFKDDVLYKLSRSKNYR